MREFTDEEKIALVDGEGKHSIRHFARIFGCTPKDIYTLYSELLESGEYRPIKREVIRRRQLESERLVDAVQMEATKSRPYVRGIRDVQDKSRKDDINN